jgi:solute carrier family 25 (mitochondrial aspartate/glutamate transporter), member 12/13
MDNNFQNQLVVGGLSGFLSSFIMFPVDTIKTRLQSNISLTGAVKMGSFYKGLPANLIGIIPEKAIKLAVNDQTNIYLSKYDIATPFTRKLMAGATAGIAQSVATNPMDIIKIRSQVERKSVITVSRELGLRGMYQGIQYTMLRDSVFTMSLFASYDYLYKTMDRYPLHDYPSIRSLASGMVAGGLIGGLITPLDVIKTRMQNTGGKEKYKTGFNCIKEIYKGGGVKGLYTSVGTRMIILSGVFGISLTFYNQLLEK